MFRVYEETLDRIIEAEGTYIEDAHVKRTGYRGAAEAELKKERKLIPVDKAAMNGFSKMLIKMEKGEGVSFAIEKKDILVMVEAAIADIQAVDVEEEVGEVEEENEDEDDET
jgi:hypothetical protein